MEERSSHPLTVGQKKGQKQGARLVGVGVGVGVCVCGMFCLSRLGIRQGLYSLEYGERKVLRSSANK